MSDSPRRTVREYLYLISSRSHPCQVTVLSSAMLIRQAHRSRSSFGLIPKTQSPFQIPVSPFFAPLRYKFARAGRSVFHDPGITVTVASGGADYFFVDDLPPKPPPIQYGEAWITWAVSNGGVEWGEIAVWLTLVCHSPVTVILLPPIMEVGATPTRAGKHTFASIGGGPFEELRFDANLDLRGIEYPVVSLVSDGGQPLDGPLAWSFAQGEAKHIRLRVKSSSGDLINWHARLPVLVDGKTQFIKITDQGKDFVFVGSGVKAPGYVFQSSNVDGAPEWIPANPTLPRFWDRDEPSAAKPAQ
jgi:hypothetical protein